MEEMVLAIPYFLQCEADAACAFVAYMPLATVKGGKGRARCLPARFKDGKPMRRREHARFFDAPGLMERPDWPDLGRPAETVEGRADGLSHGSEAR
jgi:hypothetical protein